MFDKKIIRELFDEKSRFIIYGAGTRGTAIARILKSFNIVVTCFVDGDIKKQGLQVSGLDIRSRAYLDNASCDERIIMSIYGMEDIFNELKELYQVMPIETADYILRMSYLNCKEYGYDNLETIDHFYSPYPLIENEVPVILPADIDLNINNQKAFWGKVLSYWNTGFEKRNTARYNSDNPAYGVVDALVLYAMICEVKPRKIVEIGSGYSSAMMLDTNEYVFDNKIQLEFIEPYPGRLKSLLKENDKISLQECNLQEANLSCIENLQDGDILFVDSSHMSKKGSDVNLIYFSIFPRLKSGVFIHIHDIFENFEYPDGWIKNGWAWNEDYIVHAFLMNNSDYEIVFFTNMWKKEFQKNSIGNGRGGSLWLKKK